MEATQEQINQVEMSAQEAKDYIAFAEDAKTLVSSPLFKKVITDGYLSNETIRLTMLLADDNMQNEESQNYLKSSLLGISQFNQYIKSIGAAKAIMEKQLANDISILNQIDKKA